MKIEKNKIVIYMWLIFLTLVILFQFVNNNQIKLEIEGIQDSLGKLWEEVGNVRVQTSELHTKINESSFMEYFERCYVNYKWRC